MTEVKILKKRKIRLPDEDIEPVWDKMTKEEKEWYEHFKKATEYHNWKSLAYLCEIAPSDQYDSLYQDLIYEQDAYKRAQYEIPKSRHPKHSEWDYGWSPATNKSSLRDHIRYDYYGDIKKPSQMLFDKNAKGKV